MHRFKQIIAIGLCVWGLYELKSAAGINVSQRYHAIDLVRLPAKFVAQQVNAWVAPDACHVPGDNK